MKYELNENALFLNGMKLEYPAEVREVLDLGDRLVIRSGRLYKDVPGVPSRNIFYISEHGEILWVIEEFKEVRGRSDYYTAIHLDEDGNLRAFHPSGFSCVIDKETGKILSYEFVR